MRRLVKNLLITALLVLTGAVLVSAWPEMKRYLKMSKM